MSILTTPRLTLRPWTPDDAPALYRCAAHPRVGPPAGWAPHESVEYSREIIKTVLSAPETYAVCLLGEDEPVGSVGLMANRFGNGRWPDDEGELGCWIAAPYWGRGLIPEALAALTRRAFCDFSMTALWYGYFDFNEQSARVAEKLGFTFDHTAPAENYDGTIFTERLCRLERETWEAAHRTPAMP